MKNPQPTSYSIGKDKAFPLRPGIRQGYLLSLLLEIKGIWIGKKEVALSLFVHDMILYIENPRGFTRTLLELINSGKLQGTRSAIKTLIFLRTCNERSEKEVQKALPFKITCGTGAPGWFSQQSMRLSISGSWVWAPHWVVDFTLKKKKKRTSNRINRDKFNEGSDIPVHWKPQNTAKRN